jgi:hypothetical protein
MEIVEYSAASLAIFNSSQEWNTHFKSYNGKWNPRLTHNDRKTGGWIFSLKYKDGLIDLVEKANSGATPADIPLYSNPKSRGSLVVHDLYDEFNPRIGVFGHTIPHKDNFKKLGGIWAPNITDPVTGENTSCWLFSSALKSVVQLYISTGKMPNDALMAAETSSSQLGVTVPSHQIKTGQLATLMGVMYIVAGVHNGWLATLTKSDTQLSEVAKMFPIQLNIYFVPVEGGWIADPAIMDPTKFSSGQNKVTIQS